MQILPIHDGHLEDFQDGFFHILEMVLFEELIFLINSYENLSISRLMKSILILIYFTQVLTWSNSKISMSKEKAWRKDQRMEKAIIKNQHKIVDVKTCRGKEKIVSFLKKKNVKTMVQGRFFMLIRPEDPLMSRKKYNNVLGELKRCKGVRGIYRDTVMVSSGIQVDSGVVENEPCPPSIIPDVLSNIERQMDDDIGDILAKSNENECSLYPTCEDGANPNWAAMELGADMADNIVKDLMKQYPNRQEKIKKAARVAVIGTGFDSSKGTDRFGVPYTLDALSVSFHKGYGEAGDPFSDGGGHETLVTGIIAGKGVKISKYLNLDLYRVTRDGMKNPPSSLTERGLVPKVSVSSTIVGKGIDKACGASDVVSISWSGNFASNIKQQEWYQTAKSKGCIVVLPADNDEKIPEDSPYIRVGGVSSKGMVKAPDKGVYSLGSGDCEIDGVSLKPIQGGASFGIPATAGVLGQIVTVLKIRGLLPDNPSKKIKLIKSILMAGIGWREENGGKPGMVNALGSVLIAKNISKNDIENHDRKKLIAIGKQAVDESCSRQYGRCESPSSCDVEKFCFENERFRSLVCSS